MGYPTNYRRRWPVLLLLFVVIVVVAEIVTYPTEIASLSRLDMAKNAEMVHNWTKSVHLLSPAPPSLSTSLVVEDEEDGRCQEWLEAEDNVSYYRNFEKDPVLIAGADQDWSSCTVGCKFGFPANKKPDATFGLAANLATETIHRSMESAQYYIENNIDLARRRGYSIIMTTSLSSDVPVGYFSWAEYDIMAPVQPKTADGVAAAFISNCGAHNFRLQALEMLEKLEIKIDSYGSCHRNHGGDVNKVDTLKRYKFSLAFENSNEEDYVTEKFFQSLVAGAIPVVIGAPNIQDFAPSSDSILHIKNLDDVAPVAKTMKYIAANPAAYNKTMRWKYEGPSDSFKALVDMAAVHSSCRLCVHVATKIHDKEETSSDRFQKRPCKCKSKTGNSLYHLYVRERGRFKMESIFLSSRSLTVNGLKATVVRKFKSLNHVPIWNRERPEILRRGAAEELKVYRIYPVGLNQRQALYTFSFSTDAQLSDYIHSHPCTKFEVIFV